MSSIVQPSFQWRSATCLIINKNVAMYNEMNDDDLDTSLDRDNRLDL